MVFAIMIDDIGEDSGPLQVIPGSHKGEVHDHHNNGLFCGGIDPTNCKIDFSKAVSLMGKAGSVHIHHTRTVHGSSVNTSDNVRRIFFIDYAAADAWPLVGVSDLDQFNARMIQGEPTTIPRLAPVPVRMPLPARVVGAAIFTQQEGLSHQYFEREV
jgi:ectoine hydroxylase-related dioxygenase (phytanoyl-CoA dioxygenase family)